MVRQSSRTGSAKLRDQTGSNQVRGSVLGSALFEARIGISARGSVWCLTVRLNSEALLGTRSLAGGSLLGWKLSFTSACLSLSQCSFRHISGLDLALPASVPGKGSARLRRLRWNRFGLVFIAACNQKCAFAASSGSRTFFLPTDFRLLFFVRGFSFTRLQFWPFLSHTFSSV